MVRGDFSDPKCVTYWSVRCSGLLGNTCDDSQAIDGMVNPAIVAGRQVGWPKSVAFDPASPKSSVFRAPDISHRIITNEPGLVRVDLKSINHVDENTQHWQFYPKFGDLVRED